MFSTIKSQISDMSPSKFGIDFEKLATNAMQKVFPGIQLSGCYYHFSNSIWNKEKKTGFNGRHEKDSWTSYFQIVSVQDQSDFGHRSGQRHCNCTVIAVYDQGHSFVSLVIYRNRSM